MKLNLNFHEKMTHFLILDSKLNLVKNDDTY
jgi:hypothetical protein